MRKVANVTISLPTDMLQKMERDGSLKDESRS